MRDGILRLYNQEEDSIMPQTLENIQPRPEERPHGYDDDGGGRGLKLSLTGDITARERSDAASSLTAQGVDLYDGDLDAIRKLTPVNDGEAAGGGREPRVYVTITDPVGLWTSALYLPEEFTYALYDPNGNLVYTLTPTNDDPVILPGFNVDTSVDGTQMFTLRILLPACSRWRSAHDIHIVYTIENGAIIDTYIDHDFTFREYFVYPQRCCEPESHCQLYFDPDSLCPCKNEPVPLVDGESVFLPVVRKWVW
jgi:hypothetical protein